MIQSDSDEPGLVHRHNLRVLEALLFAAEAPLGLAEIALYLGEGADVARLLGELEALYAGRGVNLVRRGEKWAFRTAEDLSLVLTRNEHESRPLSRAALEILAIIAYHQPCTRAEVEEIRGVASGGSTFELLMQTGWVRMRGRRRTPGRPVTYGTTEAFLDHFGLEALGDLPGLEELKGAGLLTAQLPQGFQVPLPFDGGLRDDEDALEDDGADGLAFPLDEAP
jgi:segregation and condensation protein B